METEPLSPQAYGLFLLSEMMVIACPQEHLNIIWYLLFIDQ